MTTPLKHYAYYNEQNIESAKGYDKVIFALKPYLQQPSSRFRIVQTTKNTKTGTITFEVRHASRGSSGGDLVNAQEALAQLALQKGDKKLVQRREQGVHRALTEVNVRHAFEEVVKNVAMHRGLDIGKTEGELLGLITEILGINMNFDSEALVKIATVALKKKSKDLTAQDRHRVFFEILDGRLGGAIQAAGYDSRLIFTQAQDFALIENKNARHGTVVVLRRAAKDLKKNDQITHLTPEQALTKSQHSRGEDGIWRYTPNAEKRREDEEKKAKADAAARNEIYVVGGGSGSRGPRVVDPNVALAREFLEKKNMPKNTIESLTIKNLFALAESQGFVHSV